MLLGIPCLTWWRNSRLQAHSALLNVTYKYFSTFYPPTAVPYPPRSLKRHLQQLCRGHLSSDTLWQTVEKLQCRSSSASRSPHPPLYADTFHLLKSHRMFKEVQLSVSDLFHQIPLCFGALQNHLITHSVRPWYLHHRSEKPHLCFPNFCHHIF